jgi:uncharacterized damage-inducible protein DinB
MSTLQPEQALFLRDVVVGSFNSEHAVTRRVIDAIPIGKGGYRPDDICKSAEDLAWHIVAAEHRFLDAVVNGAFDFTNTGRPAALATTADISAWYGETFRRDIESVSALPADRLVKIIDFRGLFQRPAVSFLQLGLSHSIHHRGQLSTYLRPMGAKVPAIYGESYDSALAKRPVQAAG